MLELKNICVSFRSERQDKVFGHTRQQVLFDVSLNVKRGTCLGILGESGSGKSTMGRVLCGLLKPDSGEAILDGVSVYASRAGRRNLQNKLSVVFQDYTTSANPRFRVKDIIGEGLTVRERRMLKRIDLLRMSLDDSGVSSGDETGLTVVSHKSGLEKDKETDLLEYRGKLGQIQNIEDALTRVQVRKQAAIDALHRYGADDARLEIEMMKLDLAALKLGGQEQEIEDDGFLDALNTESKTLWGDAGDD